MLSQHDVVIIGQRRNMSITFTKSILLLINVALVISSAIVTTNALSVPSPTKLGNQALHPKRVERTHQKKCITPSIGNAFIHYEDCIFSQGVEMTSCLKMAESSSNGNGDIFSKLSEKKGKILILGGSGFLGSAVANRALLEGYSVTSLSRRGNPPKEGKSGSNTIDYREGDARDKSTISSILNEDEYTAIIHCIGILFDDGSGLRSMNRFVSGSGSISEKSTSYDDITRKTAFNAIEAAEEYARKNRSNGNNKPLPFIFLSAAEAGWPDVRGGNFVENNLTPRWLRRYIDAKRAVEKRLLQQNPDLIRPIIFRPSLIYSLERIPSLPAVGAFFAGNIVGLPFVDRPMSVQALSLAIIRSIRNEEIGGVLRYKQVNELIR